MKSILIKDTTREEREEIVKKALWGSCGAECEFCSGCDNRGGGRIEAIYQPYIDGLKEIAEIVDDTFTGYGSALRVDIEIRFDYCPLASGGFFSNAEN